MTFATPLVRFRKTASLVLATTVATPLLLLAGCGIGVLNHAAATTDAAKGGMSGQIFGGPNPIIGATVKLYTTGDSSGASTGYGVATMRQEANSVDNGASYPAGDTDVNGGFQFAGGYSCPAGQFAYVVSAGGNTGASSTASGATATSTVNGVTSIAVNSGGTLYSATPTVTIVNDPSDTTGSGATATATVSGGVITKITVTSAGNFYTATPSVTITDGTGSGATATATVQTGGGVSSIPVTSAGTGYFSATVTITPAAGGATPTTPATATAIINPVTGSISSIRVTASGAGYDMDPVVTITNGSNGTVNPANTNAVLVAALGRCEDLFTGNVYTGTPIYINELSTVAAAYALGHFSTVTGSGASTVVSIGAPASNNAAQISGVSTGCVAGISTCITTATAGLAHAFLNAANLVNVFPTAGGANSSKTANPTVVPVTAVTGASGPVPLVPAPLINSIANSLVSCVNSAGGVANDGSACGTIFKLTTLPSAVATNYTYTTGTTAPTNTFSAMVNLAINPSLSGSTTNVTSFYNVAGTFTSVFTPTLASAPTQDYTIAINFPASVTASLGTGVGNTPTGSSTNSVCPTVPCEGLGVVASGALDINDILYAGNQDASTGTVPMNILAFASNGKLLGMTTNSTTLKYASTLAVDATGYGYIAQGSGSTTSNLGVFTTGGGSVGSLTGGGSVGANATVGATPVVKTVVGSTNIYGVAVDLANNAWAAGGSANVYRFPAGAAGTGSAINNVNAFAITGTAFAPSSSLKNMGLQVDPNQNIWATAGSTSNNLAVLQNNGTIIAPTYTASFVTATPTAAPTGGITFAGSPYTAYISQYNTTGGGGIQPFTPVFGNGLIPGEVTSLTAGTLNVTGGNGEDLDQADGAGTIWAANLSSGAILTQFWAGSTFNAGYKLNPCVTTTTSATTCAVLFGTGAPKPQWVAIDSAGSTWVGAGAATPGGLVEIIGTAAPTVPLISLGKQGQLP